MSQIRWILEAASAVVGVRGRAARLLAWLVVAALAVAGTVLAILVGFREQLVAMVLRYVLPERWIAVGSVLFEQLLAPRLFGLVVNATLVLSLSLMSLFLFALREKVSVTYEVEHGLVAEPPVEPSLWSELAEVGKTTLSILSLQILVFVIGYSREPGRLAVAHILSYLVLFAATAIDFVPPLLARHRLRGSTILLALLRRPIATLGFGALFSAPGLFLGQLAPGASPLLRLALVVGSSALVTAWATVGGTRMAARMYGDGRGLPLARRWLRAGGWILLLALVAWEAWLATILIVSVERKSQLLKCHYRLVPSSIAVELPRLGALLHKQLATTVRFTIEIENPTTHDVELEESRLVVENGAERVGELVLSRLRVPAGERVRSDVTAPLEVSMSGAHHLARTGPEALRLTLYVRLTERFELPVYIK